MRLPIVISLFVPTLAMAQSSMTTPPSTPTTAHGAFGLGLTNQYFFRGLQQENQGIIVQPWIELGYGLVDKGDDLRHLDLTFGLHNSLHDGPTGTGGGGDLWYEADFHVELAAGLGERLALATRWANYTSPNGFFDAARRRGFRETVDELSFTVGFDDKGLLLESIEGGLRPHATVAFELDGQRDNGTDRGIYAEFGVAPQWKLGEMASFDVTATVPVTLGWSLGDYYEDQAGGGDESFGYLDVGIELSSPLSFMPGRLGPWTGTLGLHWLLLGDNLEERNDGDTSELILSVGLATRF